MGLRFVLADDDDDDREIFREALGEVNKDVQLVTFDRAASMLETLSSSDCPDLIFLDINLPQISGWECLKTIKSTKALSDTPVVMYSTSSYQRDVQIADNLGALGLITKPSDFESLKRMLKEITISMREGRPLGEIDFIKKPDKVN